MTGPLKTRAKSIVTLNGDERKYFFQFAVGRLQPEGCPDAVRTAYMNCTLTPAGSVAKKNFTSGMGEIIGVTS